MVQRAGPGMRPASSVSRGASPMRVSAYGIEVAPLFWLDAYCPLRDPIRSGYFALYASKPGSLCLLSDRLAFTPARHLQTVGRISSLFRSAPSSPGPKPDSSDDEAEADSVLSSSSGSAKKSNFRSTLSSVLAEGGEVAILYEQIEGVTKQVNMKAFEGLLVKTKDGRVRLAVHSS